MDRVAVADPSLRVASRDKSKFASAISLLFQSPHHNHLRRKTHLAFRKEFTHRLFNTLLDSACFVPKKDWGCRSIKHLLDIANVQHRS